jgi:glutathione S-transferase
MNDTRPTLYTFRRCPYAMRARMAIRHCGIDVNSIEVVLKDKPQAMLDASPKGTVPVLCLPDESVIDESRDIMMWALSIADPCGWFEGLTEETQQAINRLIDTNDNEFKPNLDKYKYSVRFPEQTEKYYRTQGEVFLQNLEDKLSVHTYLMGSEITLADIAIFPFIRQFAFVDKNWFDASEYVAVKKWLGGFLDSDLFIEIMKKK